MSEDPVSSQQAHHALIEGRAEAVGVLTEMLRAPKNSSWEGIELPMRAAELLSEIGPDAQTATDALLSTLNNEDPHIRSMVARALPAVGVPASKAVAQLSNLLETDKSIAVLRALSEYGPEAKPALPQLVAVLRDKQLPTEVRWNAARTLGKIRDAGSEAVPVLIEHLEDKADTVREHAAEALGDIGPNAAEGVPELVAVLSDPATRVRRDAVRSLGQIGQAARLAVPDVEKLLDDPEEIVRQAAAKTLETLTLETLTGDAE